MASKNYLELPGGHIKRWKGRASHKRVFGAPPRSYRKLVRRVRRQKIRLALAAGDVDADLDLEVRDASWYW